jgi:hypothetical protein
MEIPLGLRNESSEATIATVADRSRRRKKAAGSPTAVAAALGAHGAAVGNMPFLSSQATAGFPPGDVAR